MFEGSTVQCLDTDKWCSHRHFISTCAYLNESMLPLQYSLNNFFPMSLFCSILSPLSPLWQHKADSHHLDYEQRLLTDRGQGFSPLPLHQNPWIPALRAEAGVQGRTHQGCGYHHQGSTSLWKLHDLCLHWDMANIMSDGGMYKPNRSTICIFPFTVMCQCLMS